MKPGIITLTTDFGLSGPYVAAVKGVLLELAPGAQLVDVCHTIAPQNILEGGFVLANIVDAFPAGTVHLAVVDPGVGTDRPLIAVSAAGQWFVLPDNGLITGVTRRRPPDRDPGDHQPGHPPQGRLVHVPRARHPRPGRGPPRSWAGRPEELGPPLSNFVTLRNFEPSPDDQGCVGEVIFRDTFGNLITNIHGDRLADSARTPRTSRSPASGSGASCGPTASGRPAASSPCSAARVARGRRRQRRCRAVPHRRPRDDGPAPAGVVNDPGGGLADDRGGWSPRRRAIS